MPVRLRPADPVEAGRALTRFREGVAAPADLRLLTKHLLALLVAKAPGGAVEVRVPPYAVAQCVGGTRHTRGTPPAVVETDPATWIALAVGDQTWHEATTSGRLNASGERSDLSPLLPLMEAAMTYRPTVTPEEAARMQAWHDEHYAYLQRVSEEGEVFDYLGLRLLVPPHVQVIESTSDVLGEVVRAEVKAGERVLDMGTGSGVNAILAARNGADVVAVDINPHAVEAARSNAERNGVADRVAIGQSDLFAEVEGRFDLVIFDPPFRWMKPRDWAEASIADEDYRSLTAFFATVREHLVDGGRVLVFFGTTADVGYLEQLVTNNGLRFEVVNRREMDKDGHAVEYRAYRIEVADLALPGSVVGA